MFRKSKISRSMMTAAEKRKLPIFKTPAAITRRIQKVDRSIAYYDKITDTLDAYGKGKITGKNLQKQLNDINSEIKEHRKMLAVELGYPIGMGALAGLNIGLGASGSLPAVSTFSGAVGGYVLTGTGISIFNLHKNKGAYIPHRQEVKELKHSRNEIKPVVKMIETLTPAEAAKLAQERRIITSKLHDYASFLEEQQKRMIEQQRAKKVGKYFR